MSVFRRPTFEDLEPALWGVVAGVCDHPWMAILGVAAAKALAVVVKLARRPPPPIPVARLLGRPPLWCGSLVMRCARCGEIRDESPSKPTQSHTECHGFGNFAMPGEPERVHCIRLHTYSM